MGLGYYELYPMNENQNENKISINSSMESESGLHTSKKWILFFMIYILCM